jgi:hypothetical protein
MMVGLLLVAIGLFLIFMAYGFASMVDPEIEGPARAAEVWRRMTGAGSPLGLGIVMIVGGVWLAVSKPKGSR